MKKWILFIILVLSIDAVFALGAMPAKTDFFGNKEHSGVFTVIPSSNLPTRITIGVEGELDVEIAREGVVIGPKEFSFNLSGPFGPGEHQAKIVVYEEPAGSGTVTTKPSVHHTVNLFVPYPEEYLKTELLVIDDSQYLMKFTTVMENKGAITIGGIENDLNIYENKEKVASLYKAALVNGFHDVVLGYKILGNTEKKILSLPKATFTIEPGKSHENQLTIKKFLFKPGEYDAESIIKFSGKAVEETGSFRIGEEGVLIFLGTRTAVVDKINRINMFLGSNWNKELEDVNLTADIIRNGTVIAAMEANRIDIEPNRNSSVRLHWEAHELELGSYELKAKAYYKDKTFEREFTIELHEAERKVSPLLYVAVALAIIAAALIIMIKKLKPKKRKKK
ncbi:DUF3324 domain-containing protein [Candidatus Woesearchaeota archaeon]|nr:DUF3324 domain-containing protein [Candidatus Woesearchaeota archaeon]